MIRRLRNFVRDSVFVEIVIWHVPVAVRGSLHEFKYSLALVADGVCVLRYDNEAGKGDHRHGSERLKRPTLFTKHNCFVMQTFSWMW